MQLPRQSHYCFGISPLLHHSNPFSAFCMGRHFLQRKTHFWSCFGCPWHRGTCVEPKSWFALHPLPRRCSQPPLPPRSIQSVLLKLQSIPNAHTTDSLVAPCPEEGCSLWPGLAPRTSSGRGLRARVHVGPPGPARQDAKWLHLFDCPSFDMPPPQTP